MKQYVKKPDIECLSFCTENTGIISWSDRCNQPQVGASLETCIATDRTCLE